MLVLAFQSSAGSLLCRHLKGYFVFAFGILSLAKEKQGRLYISIYYSRVFLKKPLFSVDPTRSDTIPLGMYHHPSFLSPFYNDEERTENGSKFLILFMQSLNLFSAPHYSLTDREITYRDNDRTLVKSNACSLKVRLSLCSEWQSLSC
jgi:hypothetical protein